MPPKIDFAERAQAAAAARKAALEKFKSRPSLDDPEVQARLAERKAFAEAREARLTERARQKAEDAARIAAEEAAAKKEKAARDARYAARKARR